MLHPAGQHVDRQGTHRLVVLLDPGDGASGVLQKQIHECDVLRHPHAQRREGTQDKLPFADDHIGAVLLPPRFDRARNRQ